MEVIFNGVNAVTGRYLLEPRPAADVAGAIKGASPQAHLPRLTRIHRKLSVPDLGFGPGVDPANAKQVGWGVLFHEDEDAAVKKALDPLVEHRRRQIGNDALLRVFEGYRGESAGQWLEDRGVSAGAPDPERVPYYLLLVGGPTRIPYRFCQELDVEYGVGVLDFDTTAQYVEYARSVIEYETATHLSVSKEAMFFGTRHSFDAATQLSADFLVTPLAKGQPAVGGKPAQPGVAGRWKFRSGDAIGEAATRTRLTEILAPTAGSPRPSLLFTASHGMGWPTGAAGQKEGQGALLCQDWPGIGQVTPDHFFAAANLPSDAQVHGLITFHFACFSAGTPATDQYSHEPGQKPPALTPHPFVAALPKALLSHRNGGALACIGHVERAWGYSIARPSEGTQLRIFENTLGRIMLGEPVGYAAKDFSERFAALSVALANTLEQGKKVSDDQLVADWTQRNDAGGYLVVGDPAVRLRVADLR